MNSIAQTVKADPLDSTGGFDPVYAQRLLSAEYNAEMGEARRQLDQAGVNGRAIVRNLWGTRTAAEILVAFAATRARYSLPITAARLLAGVLNPLEASHADRH